MSICNLLSRHTVLAISAAVALSEVAGAAVSRWDCNLTVPANSTGYFLNVDAKTYGTSGVSGWDLQIFSNSSSPSIVFYYATGAGVAAGSAPSYLPAANLPMGATVSAGTYFTSISDGATTATFYGSGPSAMGMWYVNAVNYFGFKFIGADGYVHYGSGKMTVGANANTRTINYLEYETTPGAAATVAPAPGVLALAGLSGLARSRRRR